MSGFIGKKYVIIRMFFLVLTTLVVSGVNSVRVVAASGTPRPSASATASTSKEEHGLSQKAEEIGRVGNFPITNSMVVSWIVALTLIVFIQFATRNMKPEATPCVMKPRYRNAD